MDATHNLQVTMIDGDTIVLPSHRPDMTVDQVARDVAHRLKGDVCLWGMADEATGLIVPGHQISHILVTAIAADPDPADVEAGTGEPADTPDPAPAEPPADQLTPVDPATPTG